MQNSTVRAVWNLMDPESAYFSYIFTAAFYRFSDLY